MLAEKMLTLFSSFFMI